MFQGLLFFVTRVSMGSSGYEEHRDLALNGSMSFRRSSCSSLTPQPDGSRSDHQDPKPSVLGRVAAPHPEMPAPPASDPGGGRESHRSGVYLALYGVVTVVSTAVICGMLRVCKSGCWGCKATLAALRFTRELLHS